MNREIAKFVTHCLVCRQVKAEYRKQLGLLQPLVIPKWKLEHISMDFVTRLPRTSSGNDAGVTKFAHFLPVKTTFSLDQIVKMYIKEIV